MLKQALREIRFHPSRFVATLVAIAISVAFLAGSAVMVATEGNAQERQLSLPTALADLIVEPPASDSPLDPAAFADVTATLREVPGVTLAEPVLIGSDGFSKGNRNVFAYVLGLPSEPLRQARLADGRWPAADGELMLSRGAAATLGVRLGDEVAISSSTTPLTLVGLSDLPSSALVTETAYLTPAGFGKLYTWVDPAIGNPGPWAVRTTPGIDPASLVGPVKAALGALPSMREAVVRPAAEVRAEQVRNLAGDLDVFKYTLWGFAAIALVVGMITISNTFTILLAQRRRQTGLLRAVGASGSQVRRRYLAEALLLGVFGSVLGIAAGLGLAAIAGAVTGSLYWGLVLPASDLAISFVVGVVVTVVAAVVPTLRGTRVSPMEALSPVVTGEQQRRASVVRAVLCGLLVVGGAALAVYSLMGDAEQALTIAIGAGALISLGVLFGAPLFVPPLLRGLGWIVGRFGVTSRLAAQNSVRNPRRASTTAVALMLAIGLIVTLQVAVSSVRETTLNRIHTSRPLDLAITRFPDESGPRPVPDEVSSKIAGLPGVAATALLTGTKPTCSVSEWGGLRALASDPAVTRVVSAQPALADDQVLISANLARAAELRTGDKIEVACAGGKLTLRVVPWAALDFEDLMVTPATLGALGTSTPAVSLWMSIPDRGHAFDIVAAVTEIAPTNEYMVTGGVFEAASMQQVLDILLLVVTALLGVAVLIALVGVSNTLGLSVMERTRESALMRALGLQARSLRVMLTVEAVMIALVGVLVGVAAGAFFGWLAVRAVGRGASMEPVFHVDVPQTIGMVALAVLAAGLASVLPGRRAAKASPVEALADI